MKWGNRLKICGSRSAYGVAYLFYISATIFLICEIGAYVNGDVEWLCTEGLGCMFYQTFSLCLGVIFHIGFGRKIELDEDGCEIRFGFIKRRYSWDRMQHRIWIDYPEWMAKRTCYPGGIILSAKPIRTLLGKVDIDKYSFAHPFSSVNIHFCTEEVKQAKRKRTYWPTYEVQRDEFYAFIERIDLPIDNLPKLN